MSKYEWLLFLHMTGAFLFLGAAVVALVFNVAALRRERPSEIALLLRLTRSTVPGFGVGGLLLLVFGLWLVARRGLRRTATPGSSPRWSCSCSRTSSAPSAGGAASPRRELAERLAAEGDQPSAELRRGCATRSCMFLDYGAALAGFVVLVLMIWKPGAGG